MPNSVNKNFLLQEIGSISSQLNYAEDRQLESCYYRALNLTVAVYGNASRHAADLEAARRRLGGSLSINGSEDNIELDSFRHKVGGILDATYEDLDVDLSATWKKKYLAQLLAIL